MTVRATIAIFCICSTFFLNALPADPVAEPLLQRGLESYRASRYADALTDLEAAAKAFLSPQQMQEYVSSGTFPHLDRLEMALVYLALAQSRLGNDDAARETVLRLMTAERIAATYARLPLTGEAAEFEMLVVRLVPDATLSPNVQVARAPTPQPVIAQAPPVPVPVPVPAPVPAPAPAVTTAETATERERYIEDRLRQERARLQREADERIAAERAEINRAADERIAQERAAVQRTADQRIAAEREAMEREVETRVAATNSQSLRSFLMSLRQADALAGNGDFERGNEIYSRIANTPGVHREILAEAAVGLYRTGAFRRAADTFRKLGAFTRGEEDLRYYNAVTLYETGAFTDAKRELSCALPYLQVTEDISRYRAKIEQTPDRQALR